MLRKGVLAVAARGGRGSQHRQPDGLLSRMEQLAADHGGRGSQLRQQRVVNRLRRSRPLTTVAEDRNYDQLIAHLIDDP
jgi:hypothetical protein